MTFYKTLTPYYDDLFPTNEKALAFWQLILKKEILFWM